MRIVYPEIQGGRVIADVEVAGLGDYFVGERTRVYIDTGKRRTIVVPPPIVYRRAGVNYVGSRAATKSSFSRARLDDATARRRASKFSPASTTATGSSAP